MHPAATLGAYALALALVFATAVGVGRAVGPVGTSAPPPAHSTDQHSTDQHSTDQPSSS